MAEEPIWTDKNVKELEKLPPRQPRGSPDNLLRAIAAGFVMMGYTAEEAIQRAKLVIFFYDSLWEEKHE